MIDALLKWLHSGPGRGIAIYHGADGFRVNASDYIQVLALGRGETAQQALEDAVAQLGLVDKSEPTEPGTVY